MVLAGRSSTWSERSGVAAGPQAGAERPGAPPAFRRCLRFTCQRRPVRRRFAGVNPACNSLQQPTCDDLKAQFFVNPTAAALYRQYVAVLASRVNTVNGRTYKDDPTIWGWDLMNEPRCFDSSICTSAIHGWVVSQSAFIKSLDRWAPRAGSAPCAGGRALASRKHVHVRANMPSPAAQSPPNPHHLTPAAATTSSPSVWTACT